MNQEERIKKLEDKNQLLEASVVTALLSARNALALLRAQSDNDEILKLLTIQIEKIEEVIKLFKPDSAPGEWIM